MRGRSSWAWAAPGKTIGGQQRVWQSWQSHGEDTPAVPIPTPAFIGVSSPLPVPPQRFLGPTCQAGVEHGDADAGEQRSQHDGGEVALALGHQGACGAKRRPGQVRPLLQLYPGLGTGREMSQGHSSATWCPPNPWCPGDKVVPGSTQCAVCLSWRTPTGDQPEPSVLSALESLLFTPWLGGTWACGTRMCSCPWVQCKTQPYPGLHRRSDQQVWGGICPSALLW